VTIWCGSSTAAYGVYLWGPTIVSSLLGIPVPATAKYFVFVASAGVVGKIVVSVVSPIVGRRRCGQLWGFLAAISLSGAALFSNTFVNGAPLLVVFLCCSDGSFSNLAPYTAETFGVRLGSSGIGQAANGLGKIVGPLSLALIAGAGNIVTPHATAGAILPAFLFLGFAIFCVGLSFSIFGVETHGIPISVSEELDSSEHRARTSDAYQQS
jgi:putative MFS transporter